jgi:DNA topoisomerase-1
MKSTDEAASVADPREVAKAAHLRYVSDTKPGIRREKQGKTFRYIGLDGEPVTDEKTLARIRSLVIPPAYTDVWICPNAQGHLQATGRDAKGRKQYRYHPRWREARDATKYDRMLAFGKALPCIRERVDTDLRRPGLTRERVLATVVRLLETTHIRVGNEEYARTNDSYGLTTLQNKHVEVQGATVRFHFRGKSGKEHEIDLRDPRAARVVKRCQELPGQELFEYVDENGERHDIGSGDVNDYLRAIAGEEFTAKDFRTWAGTVLCACCLQSFEEYQSEREARQNIVAAIRDVAEQLGNTPAVCRKCYVHPAVLDAYLEGSLRDGLAKGRRRNIQSSKVGNTALTSEEAAVLHFLRHHLEETHEQKPALKKAA